MSERSAPASSPDWPSTPYGLPDVEAMVGAVRAANERRRAAGLYTADELAGLARQRYRDYARHAHIDPRLLDRFLAPGHDWNIASDYVIRTHRVGLGAQLIVLAKRLVAPLVRLYTDHILDRQTQVNNYFCHLLHASIQENVRLEARLRAAEGRLRELETHLPAARSGE